MIQSIKRFAQAASDNNGVITALDADVSSVKYVHNIK